MAEWFYLQNDEEKGPVDAEALRELVRQGVIDRQTLVWKDGMDDWMEAGRVKGLFPTRPKPPPAPRRKPPAAPATPQNRYCRGCGAEIAAEAVACLSCGCDPARGKAFCPHCGAETHEQAVVCVKCGRGLASPKPWAGIAGGGHSQASSLRTHWLICAVLFLVGTLTLYWGTGLLLYLIAAVFACIILYRCWDAIQDGEARTTPAQAVGYLFIPAFNLYWTYVAYVGLAIDMNAYMQRRNIDGPPVSEGLARGLFIVFILANVSLVSPLLALLFLGAEAVLFVIFLRQIVWATEAIVERKGA